MTRSLRRERLVRFGQATALWAAVAYSVGWYHSITRFGVRGWPLFSPECLGAYGGYALSLSKWNPPYETLTWFVLFIVTGWSWCALLNLTSGYFGGRSPGIMMSSRGLALASSPLVALGPLVTYFAWRDGGALREAYLTAARFGIVEPVPWLGYAYLAAALVTLAAQVVVHQSMFALRGGKALGHFSITLFILLCASAGAAELVRVGWQLLQRIS